MKGRRLDPRREDPDSEPEIERTLLPADLDVVVGEVQRPAPPSNPDDISPGTSVGGHYRVVRRLGGGAIGHVYEAINTWTTRRVALKLLRADFINDADIERRFLIEAQAATRAAHPNIVEILDMGKDPISGHLYIVQDFLEGVDLHEHLRQKGRLTVLEARLVLLPVMEALAAAHEKGVLHRDLKPENVFLVKTPDGHTVPKVIDFGLARSEATAGNRVTRAGSVMGTAFYMSPEQARGEATVDARTDVWAVGVLWYEVLTGQLPFDGDNLHQVLHQIFLVDPEPIERLVPEVSPELSLAIGRAMRRDASERYATMADFIDALLTLLPDEPAPPPAGLRSSRPGRSLRPSNASASPPPQGLSLPPEVPPAPAMPSLAPPPLAPPPVRPAQEGVDAQAFDPRRVRALYVILGFALVALATVAAIALDALHPASTGDRLLRAAAPIASARRARTPRPALRAVGVPDAAVDASADVALDADEVGDAADAVDAIDGDAAALARALDDASAAETDASDGGGRRGRRHRSRHHDDDQDDGERSRRSSRRSRRDRDEAR